MNNVVSRYAEALLQQAVERDMLAHVYTDMLCFNQVCTASNLLVTTLKSPIIKHEKKLEVLHAIFRDQAHELTLSFFDIVIKKHREALLPTMARTFLARYDQHQGITTAQVTTAFPLSDQLQLQFQQVVKRIASCQKVILEQYINPDLIGGYVLRVGDKRLDQSLRKALRTLKNNCVTEGY
jgi:F-type H+-transporting ATPase subunit delta